MINKKANCLIKHYSSEALRFKQEADKRYFDWNAYGNINAFLNSQRYYEAMAMAEQIKKKYEVQIRDQK